MSWFNRSNMGGTASKAGAAPKIEASSCAHQRLAPRWDRAEDMGKSDLATSFVCEKCHQALAPDEGRALLAQRA